MGKYNKYKYICDYSYNWSYTQNEFVKEIKNLGKHLKV